MTDPFYKLMSFLFKKLKPYVKLSRELQVKAVQIRIKTKLNLFIIDTFIKKL
jgi:hypothetical protein